MKRATYVLVAVLAVVAAASAVASPMGATRSRKTTKLTAFLTVNQSVPTPKGARGSGTFTATVTGTTIKWRMTFRGMTGAVGAAHIHAALAGKRTRRLRSAFADRASRARAERPPHPLPS